MSTQKVILLDANILIRACLGSRVLELLENYEDSVGFYSPDVCFADAEKHVSTILQKRGEDPSRALLVLEQLTRLVPRSMGSPIRTMRRLLAIELLTAIPAIGRWLQQHSS